MRTRALPALLLVAAAGCAGQSITASTYPFPSPTPVCVPQLTGTIPATEMQPFLGVPAHFYVSTGQEPIDLGSWDWSWSAATDASVGLTASALPGGWYAASFPTGQFSAPIDVAQTTDGIYRVDSQALWLLGIASHQANPPSGKTLLVYQSPIPLYRFPLYVGATWNASATAPNGTLNGAPWAQVDTYAITVDSAGTLTLPDLTFQTALRVRTDIVSQGPIGAPVGRRLVSYLFECYGEVARATSNLDEPAPNFTTASEIRRLGLPSGN